MASSTNTKGSVLEKEHHVSSISPKLHIRFKASDGRVNTLITWPDGLWKVEIFASEEHAREFAKKHNMEVVEDDPDTSE